MNPLYVQITKDAKLGKGTYDWAKDYFGVWHRSKAGMLDDAIESYADGVPRAVFNRHLQEYLDTFGSKGFNDMREVLLYVAHIAEKEGFA